jgi:hypothetical protein
MVPLLPEKALAYLLPQTTGKGKTVVTLLKKPLFPCF